MSKEEGSHPQQATSLFAKSQRPTWPALLGVFRGFRRFFRRLLGRFFGRLFSGLFFRLRFRSGGRRGSSRWRGRLGGFATYHAQRGKYRKNRSKLFHLLDLHNKYKKPKCFGGLRAGLAATTYSIRPCLSCPTGRESSARIQRCIPRWGSASRPRRTDSDRPARLTKASLTEPA